MRRKDREVVGRDALEAILKACSVCRLAMVEGGAPYIVPLNFGYTWESKWPVLWFHSAQTGRKIDGLNAADVVAFEMDGEHALLEGPEACDYSFRYASLIGLGRPEFCTSAEEKTAALNHIMAHQMGCGDFTYPAPMLTRTALFRIEVTEMTGKRQA